MQWFALRVTYGRELKLQSLLREQGIETFIPMKNIIKTSDGKTGLASVPAINNLIFAYSAKNTLNDWIKLEGETSMTRFIWDKNTREPIVVPQRQMEDFIKVSESGCEDLVYLSEVSPKLREGQRVKVISGPFAGIEGTVVRIRQSRRVLVELPGLMAVATAYIQKERLAIKP